MDPTDIISPPEVGMTPKRGGFWKQLGMLVLGTTVSLVLTFGTAQLISTGQRAKDRRLTALMVMSNIESFAQQMESVFAQTAEADSAIAWLIAKPIDVLEQMPNDKLNEVLYKAHYKQEFTYDRSAEKIFSNSIDTWKNMGNFQFIDNVGLCFSKMEFWSKMLNDYIAELNADMQNVTNHPDQFPGETLAMKKIGNTKIRTMLRRLHNYRRWLHDSAEELRYLNRKNMAAIGISQQELTEFIEQRQREIEIGEENPASHAFDFPTLKAEDLTTFSEYDSVIGNAALTLANQDKNTCPQP